ncbi:uncharacterized protein CLUP02_12237 [Colletotrichum lupini]|uniref:Uncharacterized protein n=1 Tax=Colletotrichum lupini TaxID=145971 RepID=A0A9Q8WL74_9PEZI|nr:uncharacterized protein CLUP02_12237 [Colletotrichum lupini]UQC86735.1 hypothetical protein CLUP02_12237 [Colletotrichum lupini]
MPKPPNTTTFPPDGRIPGRLSGAPALRHRGMWGNRGLGTGRLQRDSPRAEPSQISPLTVGTRQVLGPRYGYRPPLLAAKVIHRPSTTTTKRLPTTTCPSQLHTTPFPITSGPNPPEILLRRRTLYLSLICCLSKTIAISMR